MEQLPSTLLDERPKSMEAVGRGHTPLRNVPQREAVSTPVPVLQRRRGHVSDVSNVDERRNGCVGNRGPTPRRAIGRGGCEIAAEAIASARAGGMGGVLRTAPTCRPWALLS
jgi:hypothetical protein